MSEIYTQQLSKRLNELRIGDKYADFKLHAGEESFNCHRIILAALSPYFEIMFDSEFMEGREQSATLEMDGRSCNDFLTYLYTGRADVVTMENAAILLHTAHLTQVSSLHNVCKDFLKKNVSKSNCIEVWCVSQNQGDTEDLAVVARSLILKHFVEIASSEECNFDDIDTVENLISILNSENLNVIDRNGLFCRVTISWVTADIENRFEYLKDLYKNLLAKGITGEEILNEADRIEDVARRDEILAELERLRQIIDVVPEEPMPFDVPADECLIVAGGNEGGNNTHVMCFSFPQKTWYSLKPIPLDPGYNFAICSIGLDLYVSGGSGPWSNVPQGCRGGKCTFLRFNGETNEWLQLTNLPSERECHAMYAFNQVVYVLGGKEENKPTNKVFKYNARENEWALSKTRLYEAIRSPAHTCLGQKVYLFGGFTTDGEKSENIQCFNCEHDQSYLVNYTRLPVHAKIHARALNFNNQLLLVCKNGDILKCSEKEGVRSIAQIQPYTDRKGFGVCCFENNILIFGGEVSFRSTKDMLLFNVERKLCTVLQETLPVSAIDFSFTTSRVQRRLLTTPCATTMAAV